MQLPLDAIIKKCVDKQVIGSIVERLNLGLP